VEAQIGDLGALAEPLGRLLRVLDRPIRRGDGRTVYYDLEVLDFLERVKARGKSRAPWRGSRSVA
jgi:hypothetical protein